MNTYPVFKELVPIEIDLDNIHLDPNNPRFISMNWDTISQGQITEESTQRKVMKYLEDNFSVDRLVSNMEINGFLPIDRVVVKKINDNDYVVLEGNRRICAAKILKQKHLDDPTFFSEEIIDSISKISCLEYTGSNTEASWIFQGLRHIMGIQEWSAFNKARLIVSLMESEELSLTEVGKRFGLTAFGAGQWVRGYFAFKQAKEESDYIREVDEKAYPYFQELFSRSNSSIRNWLGWNENDRKFDNDLNFNEFLSWLYPRNVDDLDESVNESDVLGDWKNRKLLRSDDIRQVSFLYSKSPKEFDFFRHDGNLEKAYTIAIQKQYEDEAKKNANPSEEIFVLLDNLIKNLENIPFKIISDNDLKDKFFEKVDKIESIYCDLKKWQ